MISEIINNWKDTEIFHRQTNEDFAANVFEDKALNAHRKWVRENIFGFGEDSFHWAWKMLVDEMPEFFVFGEIGCFRFQIVSLIRLLADRTGKSVRRICITPLSTAGGLWESDYAKDAETIHDQFGLAKNYIVLKGLSNEPDIVKQAKDHAPFNIFYVDGSHTYDDALFDLRIYAHMIKPGGYLVVDDAACRTSQPFGYFQGIQPVCDALETWEKEQTGFEFQFNVVHLMVYKRK